MSSGAYKGWENPGPQRDLSNSQEKIPFRERIEAVLDAGGDKRIQQNTELAKDILGLMNPYDETECEGIASRYDLDPAVVGAMALRSREEAGHA